MLCRTGVGFDPVLNGQALRFDLLGLYKGVFLMRDRTTGSVFAHLDGLASQGPLAGERLSIIPIPLMRWAAWKAEYPHTLVLDNNTPYQSEYSDAKAMQTDQRNALYGDGRLPADDLVVGVEANGAFAGFHINAVAAAGGVVNGEVGGVPVVVVYDSSTNTGIAFKRTVDGQVLTFSAANSANLVLVDDATGSWWGKSDGRALIGDMKGTSLEFATSFISAWYGWSAYHPQTALYTD